MNTIRTSDGMLSNVRALKDEIEAQIRRDEGKSNLCRDGYLSVIKRPGGPIGFDVNNLAVGNVTFSTAPYDVDLVNNVCFVGVCNTFYLATRRLSFGDQYIYIYSIQPPLLKWFSLIYCHMH